MLDDKGDLIQQGMTKASSRDGTISKDGDGVEGV